MTDGVNTALFDRGNGRFDMTGSSMVVQRYLTRSRGAGLEGIDPCATGNICACSRVFTKVEA